MEVRKLAIAELILGLLSYRNVDVSRLREMSMGIYLSIYRNIAARESHVHESP